MNCKQSLPYHFNGKPWKNSEATHWEEILYAFLFRTIKTLMDQQSYYRQLNSKVNYTNQHIVTGDTSAGAQTVFTHGRMEYDQGLEYMQQKNLSNLPSPSSSSQSLVISTFHSGNPWNASSSFLRATLYRIPTTSVLSQEVQLPMGVVISPLVSSESIQYVPTASEGPVRCMRCYIYMNPHVKFTDAGHWFGCPCCSVLSPVPAEYFNYLDVNGMRVDQLERPELSDGAYDFQPSQEQREHNAPAFIFAIDVSHSSISSGIVNVICSNVSQILNQIPNPMKIAFITYDTTIHFYSFSRGSFRSLVVSDLESVFVPSCEGFFVDPIEDKESIQRLLEEIPRMFEDTEVYKVTLLPVIEAAIKMLQVGNTYGKVILYHSSLPTQPGPGVLKDRIKETHSMAELLKPSQQMYCELGKQCSAYGCGVDIFLFNNSYTDLSTVGRLSQLSGGDLFSYPSFNPMENGRLLRDMERSVTRTEAFKVTMKIRTSIGIDVKSIYGNCCSNGSEITVGSMTNDHSFAAAFEVRSTLPEDGHVFVQVALWYVTTNGQCKIRVLNLKLGASSDKRLLFGSCDLDSTMNFLTKHVLSANNSSAKMTEALKNIAVKILIAYRNSGTENLKSTQLLLPKTMELFPLYVSCLLKTPAFVEKNIDQCVFHRSVLMSMSVDRSAEYIYPKVICLTGEYENTLRCTKLSLDENHIYLISNGIVMYFWVGGNVHPQVLTDLFGNKVLHHWLNANIGTDGNIKNFIDALDTSSIRSQKRLLMRSGEHTEVSVKALLYEDARPGSNDSYMDFILMLHKKISESISS